MLIRKATAADITAAEKIYDNAKAFMRKCGNPSQWNSEHPNASDVLAGIEHGTSYICEDEGEIVASFYFEMNADDPTYHKIYEGEWKNDAPYGVIHRIAVKYPGRGIGDFCINECFKIIPNIRIDTHRDNIPMQLCLKKSGFKYCGIIYLANGDERMAYQKIK